MSNKYEKSFSVLLDYTKIGNIKKTKNTIWESRMRRVKELILHTMRKNHANSLNLNNENMNAIGYTKKYNRWKRRFLARASGKADVAGILPVDLKLTGNFRKYMSARILTPKKTANGKILRMVFVYPPKPAGFENKSSYKFSIGRYEKFKFNKNYNLNKRVINIIMNNK